MAKSTPVLEVSLGDIPLLFRGKVRDVFDLGDKLLIVATDRISAFDFILPTPIPDKGKILNQISRFWFDCLKDTIPNHLITTDIRRYPDMLKPYEEILKNRSMLVKRAKRIDIECVARGYLAGSGWKEYKATGEIAGIPLPPGLRESEELPQPIFTPATKAEGGEHDENISFKRMQEVAGEDLAFLLREKSLALYKKASTYAREKGIIIADTKFEFGRLGKEIILIDEALTPDSSRFWDEAKYEVGRSQDSFDKQFVRDYLESINWNKQPPVPELPQDIVEKTREKYLEAYRRLLP